MRLIPLLLLLTSLLGGCIAEPIAMRDDVGDTAQRDRCRPGQVQPTEDGCNQCRCDDTGAWQCGQLACIDPCAIGETQHPDDCLLCTCAEAGWQCEDTCAVLPEPADAGIDDDGTEGNGDDGDLGTGGAVDRDCAPSETRAGECGDCQCDVDGTWLCDDAECPPSPNAGCALDADCVIVGCQLEVCALAETQPCDADIDSDLCFGPEITTCGCVAGQCVWAQTDALLSCLDP